MSKSLQFYNKCNIVKRLYQKGRGERKGLKTFFGGIFIETSKLKEEGIGYPIKVEYYKLTDKNQNEITYGIELVKKEYKSKQIQIEKEQIKSLSKDECKIERMLELFKQNEVTPISAKEIIDDFFGKTLVKSTNLV